MNWVKLSSFAEIVSSVAIVATLVYLSVQTQQNTSAIEASSRHTMISNDLVITQVLIDYPSMRGTMYKKEVSEDEQHRLEGWLISLARTREHQWTQYQNDLLDKETLDAYLTGLTINISFPRTRIWWDTHSYAYFDDAFVDEINVKLKSIPIDENYILPFDRIESL